MIVTKTPRLILRFFTPEDLDALAPILADPEVMKFSVNGVKTREETQKFIDWMLSSYKEYNFGLYAVIHQKSQQLIGFCGLLLWSFEEQPEIEIGYRLARDYWGQGLGTEAARAVKDYAWNNWGFNRLICIIQPENTRSIRVAEKIGMHYERDTIFMDLDVNIYSIDKKKFPTN